MKEDLLISSHGWKKYLRQYSQIIRHAETVKSDIIFKKSVNSGRILEWHSEKLSEKRIKYKKYPNIQELKRDPDPIIEFEDRLFELLKYFDINGISAVVLAQPVLWQKNMKESEIAKLWFPVVTISGPVRPSPKWLEEEMKRYNAVQKKCAELNSAEYIPLDELVTKSDDVFFDDCHFTDKGNELVAENVFPVVYSIVKKAITAFINPE